MECIVVGKECRKQGLFGPEIAEFTRERRRNEAENTTAKRRAKRTVKRTSGGTSRSTSKNTSKRMSECDKPSLSRFQSSKRFGFCT